jgi:hypothetical protein
MTLPQLSFEWLFGVLLALNLLDVWTTIRGLKTRKAKEANKPLRKLMEKIGVKEALTVAMAVSLVPVWLLRPTEPWLQWVLIGINAAAVINNLRVLRKIGAL